MANKPATKETEPSSTPAKPPVENPGFFHRYRLHIALVILLVVVAGGAGYYIFVHPKHHPVAAVAPKPHIPDATWLATPQKIVDPGVFVHTNSDLVTADPSGYEKVGSYYGKDLILDRISLDGLSKGNFG
jgi:hypothetical protein